LISHDNIKKTLVGFEPTLLKWKSFYVLMK
jgi:hypothetical protein